MEFSPFFRRPYYYYNQNRYMNQPYSMYNTHNEQERRVEEKQATLKRQQYNQNKTSFNKKQYNETDKNGKENLSKTRETKDNISPIFEIFGIKLFFDDILIIALIFFLYDEGVRDNLLFISLILLLLS